MILIKGKATERSYLAVHQKHYRCHRVTWIREILTNIEHLIKEYFSSLFQNVIIVLNFLFYGFFVRFHFEDLISINIQFSGVPRHLQGVKTRKGKPYEFIFFQGWFQGIFWLFNINTNFLNLHKVYLKNKITIRNQRMK